MKERPNDSEGEIEQKYINLDEILNGMKRENDWKEWKSEMEWRIEYKGRDEKRPDLPSLPFTTFKSIPSTVSLSPPSAINRIRDIIFPSRIIFPKGLKWTRDWAIARERGNERINIGWMGKFNIIKTDWAERRKFWIKY